MIAGLGVGVAPWAPAAHADTPPFSDSNVQGLLGLCDAAGNPIRSGSMTAKPFVPIAVASVASPSGYGATEKAKATLYMFQPRRDVDPGQWSGTQLTGSSLFFDNSHPMAAGTNLDPSLHDAVTAYPANWDGYLQLRIYYTAPNKLPQRRSYPAAVLHVQGGTWTVVQGADIHCETDKVLSSERIALPSSAFNQPSTSASGTAGSASASARSTAKGSSTSPATASTSGGSTAASASSNASASTATSTKSSATPWVLGALAAVVAAAAGVLVWRRRLGVPGGVNGG